MLAICCILTNICAYISIGKSHWLSVMSPRCVEVHMEQIQIHQCGFRCHTAQTDCASVHGLPDLFIQVKIVSR